MSAFRDGVTKMQTIKGLNIHRLCKSMEGLKKFTSGLSEAEMRIFMHGVNHNMYVTAITNEIRKHNGPIHFHTIIHRENTLDVASEIEESHSDLEASVEAAEPTAEFPDARNYCVVSFSSKTSHGKQQGQPEELHHVDSQD